jgi:hypothetical protein
MNIWLVTFSRNNWLKSHAIKRDEKIACDGNRRAMHHKILLKQFDSSQKLWRWNLLPPQNVTFHSAQHTSDFKGIVNRTGRTSVREPKFEKVTELFNVDWLFGAFRPFGRCAFHDVTGGGLTRIRRKSFI